MKNLIPHFIQEEFLKGNQHGFLTAFTMFIDMSGFTPLTETLMKHGNEGAEELSIILNDIFGPTVRMVYNKKGCIPYFAGDAFTAIFTNEKSKITPREFIETAKQIRDLFIEHGIKKTKFGDFQIGIKIGLSYGTVEWGIIGDENKSFYFRGQAIDDCADAQSLAQEQEIIFDKNVILQFDNNPPLFKKLNPQLFILDENSNTFLQIFKPKLIPNLQQKIASKFLPNSVVNFNQQGEFRDIISVFISFEGVDNHELLNKFGTIVLQQINNFSGYFKEIDFGDKGGLMIAFFGAPISFENNIERALEFISVIQEITEPLQKETGLKFRAGITAGLAYMGIVGGEERCQYAAVGNFVNLAARIMLAADWGEILTDSTIQKNKQFTFSHHGNIHYKGIEGDIPTYKLTARNENNLPVFSGFFIGRDKEIALLEKQISVIFHNNFGGVTTIFGEAGIGKSRLTYELRKRLEEKGQLKWFTCQADQILRKSFNPFIYWLKNYFKQSIEGDILSNQKKFELHFNKLLTSLSSLQKEGKKNSANVEEVQKELVRTESILAALLGINSKDSLWSQLNAKGRYQNTLAALSNLFIAEALLHPVVIELEDGHWFDDDSKAFLKAFLKNINTYPFLLLITSRYKDDGSKPTLIEEEDFLKNNITSFVLDLNILDKDALKVFAEEKLKGKIDTELHQLLLRTTNGNPFYAEQIVAYFKESQLLKKINNEWHIKDKSVKISGSINSILLARIDRLSTLVKETVKAAAVIGREFEIPILNEVMKEHEAFLKFNGNSTKVLQEQVQTAEQGQIWRAMNELRYIFKHSLLREAVYDMQLKTRLRHLHQLIAQTIEKIYTETIEEKYVDLAFHYEQAENAPKTIEYLKKSADFARSNFQNQQALLFYDKLLEKQKTLDKTKQDNYISIPQINILLKKGAILELIGQWESCEKVYSLAYDMARQTEDKILIGRSNTVLGKLLLLKGDYEKARIYLEAAASYFELSEDRKGIAKAYGNLGTLFFRQGQYDEAKAYFLQSIELNQSFKPTSEHAQIVASLGLTYNNQGNYYEAILCQKNQLEICEEMNDKQGMATLNTNLGIVYSDKGEYDLALDSYKKGLALSEELGNKLLKSICIGCIGIVYQHKGDFETAMENFDKDLQLCEELGDKQGIAIAFSLVAELLAIKGEFEKAIPYLEKTLAMSEDLNYKKGVAKTLNTLGDVYTFKKDFDRAVFYYDKAIDLTQKINSKLVLGFSLIEKGFALVLQKKYKEAKKAYTKGIVVVNQLNHADLLFQTSILSAQLSFHSGDIKTAKEVLTDLLITTKNKIEEARIHYELHKIIPEKNIHKEKALKAYTGFLKKTPKFEYKIIVEELQH